METISNPHISTLFDDWKAQRRAFILWHADITNATILHRLQGRWGLWMDGKFQSHLETPASYQASRHLADTLAEQNQRAVFVGAIGMNVCERYGTTTEEFSSEKTTKDGEEKMLTRIYERSGEKYIISPDAAAHVRRSLSVFSLLWTFVFCWLCLPIIYDRFTKDVATTEDFFLDVIRMFGMAFMSIIITSVLVLCGGFAFSKLYRGSEWVYTMRNIKKCNSNVAI
jgi:hypothetical protein